MSTKPPSTIRIVAWTTVILGLLSWATASQAQLTLTPVGLARGFALSDFATGFPHEPLEIGYGPIGIAFLTNQSVLVTDTHPDTPGPGAHFYLYSLPSHANGQVITPANVQFAYPAGTGNCACPWAMAQVQRPPLSGVWHYYMSLYGDLVEINTTGAVVDVIKSGVGDQVGLAPFPPDPPAVPGPLSGHIFAPCNGCPGSFNGAIWDINPVTHAAVQFAGGGGPYGSLAFSADGTILYAWTMGGAIHALSVPGASDMWTAPFPSDPDHDYAYDGVAVGVGNLDGYIYVSGDHNNGIDAKRLSDLWEIGTPFGSHPGELNLIATGGPRGGELLATDPNFPSVGNPSLLITQADRIVRVTWQQPPSPSARLVEGQATGGGWLGPPTSSMLPVVETTSVPAGRPTGSGAIRISPNPAAGPARIDFDVEREATIHLGVFDVQGREVAVLADGPYPSGTHHATWSGATHHGKASTGIYLVRLQVGGRVVAQKVALTR